MFKVLVAVLALLVVLALIPVVVIALSAVIAAGDGVHVRTARQSQIR